MTDREKLQDAGCLGAAIMFYWMESGDYHRMYDTERDEKTLEQLGGFVGLQELAGDAAIIFQDEEQPYEAGVDFEWIDAVEEYARLIASAVIADGLVASAELHEYAADAIKKARAE